MSSDPEVPEQACNSLQKHIDYYCLDSSQFKKIKSIKEGGFGNIYLVEEIGTKNRYAAKQMKQFGQYIDHKFFVREIDIFMRVPSYCVIGFKGFSFSFDNKDIPTIYLELAEGGSIRSKVQEAINGKLDPNWTPTKRMISLVGVSYGMMRLHQQNVIHRDLKSDNVLLDKNFHPKITDFGLSKFENKDTQQSILGIGTPAYMAPELSTDSDFDNSVDVYAFGIMAYEIITLRDPYDRKFKAPIKLITAICAGLRPTINEGDMPDSLSDLLQRCWDEVPTNRPSFQDITTCLFKEEYQIPGVDEEEYLAYLNLLGKDFESTNATYEASQKIDQANRGDVEMMKTVADGFFEGKDGFPHDEVKALHFYRLFSCNAGKSAKSLQEIKTMPIRDDSKLPISRDDSMKTISSNSRYQKSQTVVLKKPVVIPEEKMKMDYILITQRFLQTGISSFNFFIYGKNEPRQVVLRALTCSLMTTEEFIADNIVEHHIARFGISIVEAQNIGKIPEETLTSFVTKRASSKCTTDQRIRHFLYCVIGDDDSIFTDNDERIVKNMSKIVPTSIFILNSTGQCFLQNVLKHTSSSYILEEAMKNPKNAKKGPCIVSIPLIDDSSVFQTVQKFINFLPSTM